MKRTKPIEIGTVWGQRKGHHVVGVRDEFGLGNKRFVQYKKIVYGDAKARLVTTEKNKFTKKFKQIKSEG